jgi:hypothetical protein
LLDANDEAISEHFLYGQLSRNYSWSLNIADGDEMIYSCKLVAGDQRMLDVILSSARTLAR